MATLGWPPYGQAIRHDIVDIIGREKVGGAGHMLQDDRRFAGNVFAQMVRDDERGDFKAAAFGADENGDRFAVVKVRLSPSRRVGKDQPS
jgi:hypothetical protein